MRVIPFDNSYARLPGHFYARTPPTAVKKPHLVKVNEPLASLLGLDVAWLKSDEGVAVLAGNAVAEGSDPIALAYAGHQFGNFVPQLGDGRAILLGELVGTDGKRRDVQLKGSGPTPFSRRGDGRAALGPVLREYVVSEAMHAMGIPTTRALAAVTTGEHVHRERPQAGAVLTRIAGSHLRVGTFEYFAARSDFEAIDTLTRVALERHYPQVIDAPNAALALLECVVAAQAFLVARWLGVGFVHGVMNTDNTSISGETLDYGPCAFLDEYHPLKKFSSIDVNGRYAFMNQPKIAQWNLARLAETLLPLVDENQEAAVEQATATLKTFTTHFDEAFLGVMRAKIGLATEAAGDLALVMELLSRLAGSSVDYTIFFRRLCGGAESEKANAKTIAAMFEHEGAFFEWAERWHARLASEGCAGGVDAARMESMRKVNPAYIPRNHRLEEAIVAASEKDDFGPFEALVRVLARPYEEQVGEEWLAEAPKVEERVRATFCGT